MDSISSDEEYFDTYTNFTEDNETEQFCDGCELKSSVNSNDVYSDNINPDDKNIISSNSSDLLDVPDNFTNCSIVQEFSKDFNNSILIDNENSEKVSYSSNEKECKINMSDSSDSESLSGELNSDLLKKEEIGENEMEGGQSIQENENKKLDEEVEYDERLNLESLLSHDELENLKETALNMKIQGNLCYQSQSYDEATKLYTNAIATCPLIFKEDHATFHMNRGSAFAKLQQNDEAIKDFSDSLKLKPDYLKSLLKRAELLQKTDKLTEALEDYRQVLKIDPHNWAALHAEQTLPDQIQIQQEKMKEEMMNQLKQLGNLVLKPFGLSTDNFKLVQDPKTGSYSVNFQNK